MSSVKTISLAAVLTVLCSTVLIAQAPPQPDVLVFNNGDKLIGHFVRATAGTVTFHSDALGNLTIDWSKVKELQTDTKVAIIRKGAKIVHRSKSDAVPQGTLTMHDQSLILTPAPATAAQPIPVAEAEVVIEQPAFEKAIARNSGFLHDWKGTVTFGASLVDATQSSQTLTSGVSLVRAEPVEDWISQRDRTSFNFSNAYGKVTQPSSPSLKTSIFHSDLERDEYIGHLIFAFGQAAVDHNYSQGLDLQQTYSGGLGWTAIRSAKQTLDLKASASYLNQSFSIGPKQSLVGSVLSEHFNRQFAHAMVADQHLTYTPAWNNTKAWSAAFGTSFTLPVYKRLGASTSVIDSFLNDPSVGFKKNSFQFTLGASWTLP